MKDPVRTDMYCHHCRKNFIATLDMALDGQHTVECPYCGHHHYRVIKDGKVTEARWTSNNNLPQHKVDQRCVWKADSQPIITSVASAFIRDRWLNREDLVL